MIVKAHQGQTIYDLAATYYGCFEGVFLILEDNKTIGLDTELVPGQSIAIRDEVPRLNDSNQNIAMAFKNQNLQLNSTYIPEPVEGAFLVADFEPIDYLV